MTSGSQTSVDQITIAPDSPEEVAATLHAASDRRQSLLIRGEGSKLDWGRPAPAADITLDTRRLNRLLAHAHGDLTATIEAGARLSDVNAALIAHRQWLPIDPSFADRATIGGLLATNDSGPRRHRHGTPRDLVIGMRIATTDGVLAKSGGQVVKNVAGYDLARLMTGSFGSLAVIVSATFKLAPVPAASRTLIISFATTESLARAVCAIMASQLEPVAVEIRAQLPQAAEHEVVLQFASLPVVVEAQVQRARAEWTGGASRVQIHEGSAEQSVWRSHAERLWLTNGAVVRASWMPANLAAVIEELDRARAASGCDIDIVGRAALGAGLLRIGGDDAAQAQVVNQLRASSTFGHVVILRGSTDLKTRVDVWGSIGDRGPLLASLKRTFDPQGLLNQGRGPL